MFNEVKSMSILWAFDKNETDAFIQKTKIN